MSVLNAKIEETPIAIIDLETTGLSAVSDRIVEIAVVRIEPGEKPRLALDTLVDPQRRVTCSSIHGIYDEDVEGAPLFRELLAPLSDVLDGAVVASFNVYFDMKFVEAELRAAKTRLPLPHMCMMWLRPALGLGARSSLDATCHALGVELAGAHRAASDAMATAELWERYTTAARESGIQTFGDLAGKKSYKFMQSFSSAPLSKAEVQCRPLTTALKPRRNRTLTEEKAVQRAEWNATNALQAYWDALSGALVDRHVSREELESLRQLQNSPHLDADRVRFVHGRVFAGLLDEATADRKIDSSEVEWLAHVSDVLRELGWSPGASADGPVTPAPAPALPVASSEQPRHSFRIELLPPEKSWWERMFG
jgi:DNA polymerase-3 subunit epsilon